ncbi:tetratricopeptide repeat protein [Aestuariivita boseongensis]|uniref:tetratricopeptide repeat protein n=1 Tax=Aestuariivita boseongensis TaxID=1470562 RepID=UPI0006808526|nr:tetratricopeptide repeat protein [Aestuariivita boseongensis]
MSDTDSFIDEVTEEVRRDQLYAYLRRYGWIAVVVILAIVGGTAFNEYRQAQDRSQAEALGDALIAALEEPDAASRAGALEQIAPQSAGGQAVRDFLLAAEETAAGRTDAAVATLDAISSNGDLPEIYRQIAAFKALTLQAGTLSVEERRLSFERLARPNAPLRLLALEQLALIDIETGDTDAAIARLRDLVLDAEATTDLQQRARQAIVALGGELELAPGQQG